MKTRMSTPRAPGHAVIIVISCVQRALHYRRAVTERKRALFVSKLKKKNGWWAVHILVSWTLLLHPSLTEYMRLP